jgi:hypothetical protein
MQEKSVASNNVLYAIYYIYQLMLVIKEQPVIFKFTGKLIVTRFITFNTGSGNSI